MGCHVAPLLLAFSRPSSLRLSRTSLHQSVSQRSCRTISVSEYLLLAPRGRFGTRILRAIFRGKQVVFPVLGSERGSQIEVQGRQIALTTLKFDARLQAAACQGSSYREGAIGTSAREPTPFENESSTTFSINDLCGAWKQSREFRHTSDPTLPSSY